MILNFFILIFLCVLIFHVVTRFNRRGRLIRKIPGPTPYPIFGNLLRFNVNCMHKFWNAGQEIVKKYYPVTRFWLCTTAVVSIIHPDDLEKLFTSSKCNDKGYIYDYLQPWLKTGLLTSSGEKWRQRRKILTPAFHFSILKKYLEITYEEGKKLINDIKTKDEIVISDLAKFCADYTLNIICESAMGVSLEKMDNEDVNRYKKAVHDFGNIAVYRMSRPYIQTWMMNFIWKIGSIQRKALKILHRFTDQVIKDRKKYHTDTANQFLKNMIENINTESIHEIHSGRKRRMAMLDLLLAAEHNGLIDYKGIKEEVDTFMFEGHDTTAMALTFTLMLLAENKNAQDLARLEVTEIFNKVNGQIEITHLQELNYLDRCIKESLRLFPPVATILRHTTEDLPLKNVLVPADSQIIIHLYNTHRDPNFWLDPNKFEPDRFLPENSKNRHPFAYVPFSAGSRNCIGQKFAILEMKSIIGQFLYNFYLEPINKSSDVKLIADIILRTLDPIQLKLIKIHK